MLVIYAMNKILNDSMLEIFYNFQNINYYQYSHTVNISRKSWDLTRCLDLNICCYWNFLFLISREQKDLDLIGTVTYMTDFSFVLFF